ncbi:MAG: hypothetical protein AVO35_10025 [Candidatus Aegiribacteria sp. MLS_C]|nr:MAG: hypothetical protein AVO35_10025 [Candidatus Aegiribacteria sp. MLS_C]
MNEELAARIHVGTSGWQYSHWKGSFYPEDADPVEMLELYCRRFRTVEVNSSFYRVPSRETAGKWADTAGSGFVFSVKVSRYITHMKKLNDPEEPLGRFFDGIGPLGGSTGPLLFQLPPSWGCDPDRLRSFLRVLPGGYRYAFEFRDRSWLNGEVFSMLRNNDAALCIYDLEGFTSPKEVTADFVYVRLHGPGAAYEGSYGKSVLAGWAGAFSSWAGTGRDVYCYFDNDQKGYAASDALSLERMIRR